MNNLFLTDLYPERQIPNAVGELLYYATGMCVYVVNDWIASGLAPAVVESPKRNGSNGFQPKSFPISPRYHFIFPHNSLLKTSNLVLV